MRDFMNRAYLEKLADLTVKGGVNVQKGQLVVLQANVESAEFARLVTKKAYEAGAGQVIVKYSDEICDHESYLHGDSDKVFDVMDYEALFFNETARKGACYIRLSGGNPNLMADVPAVLMTGKARTLRQKSQEYRKKIDDSIAAWTIVPSAEPAWAKQVYPDLDEEEAMEKLWQDIFEICRIDENDPMDNWAKHKASFEKKMDVINNMHLKSVHYKNSLGTDLEVQLPEGYIFTGGGTPKKDGVYFFPNIPTEELFAAPYKTGVNGKLYAAMPLVYNGAIVEDFWFEFKDGKVVDFDAKKGKSVLESILNNDEGSRYLGEIALVPYGSPISAKQRLFYKTLIDENASCHFALGASYPETVENGLEMNEEERLAHGLNQSLTHVDFMVGTKDLSIIGKDAQGNNIVIFEDGKYTPEFD
jgi:aminopeptidase